MRLPGNLRSVKMQLFASAFAAGALACTGCASAQGLATASARLDGVFEASPRGVVSSAQARFDQVWLIERPVDHLLTKDGKEPPLTKAARKLFQDHATRRSAGDLSFDPTSWCASPGIPRLMLINYPFEIVVRPDVVAFHYEWNRWGRLVELNIQPLELLYTGPTGIPTGHWEGDTLVIETTGLIDTSLLDNAGLPHSDALKLTERLTVLADGRLENTMSFNDPANYSAPWTATVTYRAIPDGRIREDVCLDRIKLGEPAIRP